MKHSRFPSKTKDHTLWGHHSVCVFDLIDFSAHYRRSEQKKNDQRQLRFLPFAAWVSLLNSTIMSAKFSIASRNI